MVSNIFKIKGLYIHLGYDLYSEIAEKCMKQGGISIDDMYSSTITSAFFYPSKNKKVKKKIYKTICSYLEGIATQDYDTFITRYYNQAYYNKNAQENISNFLDGVASVYRQLHFIVGKGQTVRFPYGKKFSLCYKKHGKNFVKVVIDTDDIACFWGSIDFFYVHFKSDLTVSFNHGDLSIYMDHGYNKTGNYEKK